jgi:hypothetical protein
MRASKAELVIDRWNPRVATVGDMLWSHTALRSPGFSLPLAAHWRSSDVLAHHVGGVIRCRAAGAIGKEIQKPRCPRGLRNPIMRRPVLVQRVVDVDLYDRAADGGRATRCAAILRSVRPGNAYPLMRAPPGTNDGSCPCWV